MAALCVPLARLSLNASSRPIHQLRCHSIKPGSCILSYSKSFLGQPPFHGTLSYPLICLPVKRRPLVPVCATTKKADSAAKRARQAEKNRVYNKARKSEMSTRIKKVLVALENLKKQTDPSHDKIAPIEVLIAEAFSVIDKSVKGGIIHRNKGAHRKSRLSRAKKKMEIQMGWYIPSAAM